MEGMTGKELLDLRSLVDYSLLSDRDIPRFAKHFMAYLYSLNEILPTVEEKINQICIDL